MSNPTLDSLFLCKLTLVLIYSTSPFTTLTHFWGVYVLIALRKLKSSVSKIDKIENAKDVYKIENKK